MENISLIRPSVCHSTSPSISHFYPSWSVTLFPIYPSNTTSVISITHLWPISISIYIFSLSLFLDNELSSLSLQLKCLRYQSLPGRTIASNVSLSGRPKLWWFCQSPCPLQLSISVSDFLRKNWLQSINQQKSKPPDHHVLINQSRKPEISKSLWLLNCVSP
jgi:hypothetical protein